MGGKGPGLSVATDNQHIKHAAYIRVIQEEHTQMGYNEHLIMTHGRRQRSCTHIKRHTAHDHQHMHEVRV